MSEDSPCCGVEHLAGLVQRGRVRDRHVVCATRNSKVSLCPSSHNNNNNNNAQLALAAGLGWGCEGTQSQLMHMERELTHNNNTQLALGCSDLVWGFGGFVERDSKSAYAPAHTTTTTTPSWHWLLDLVWGVREPKVSLCTSSHTRTPSWHWLFGFGLGVLGERRRTCQPEPPELLRGQRAAAAVRQRRPQDLSVGESSVILLHPTLL